MRWVLVGASTIAAQHMVGAIKAKGGEIAWVVSGSEQLGADFAAKHGGRAGDHGPRRGAG